MSLVESERSFRKLIKFIGSSSFVGIFAEIEGRSGGVGDFGGAAGLGRRWLKGVGFFFGGVLWCFFSSLWCWLYCGEDVESRWFVRFNG